MGLRSASRAYAPAILVCAIGGLGSLLLANAASPAANPDTSPSAKDFAARIPGDISIPFLANHGQYPDEVAFSASTFAGTVFVTQQSALVYSFPIRDPERIAKREADRRVVEAAMSGELRPPYFTPGWTLLESAPQPGDESLPGPISLKRNCPAVPQPPMAEGSWPQQAKSASPVAGGHRGDFETWNFRESLVGARTIMPAGRGSSQTRVARFIGKEKRSWASDVPTQTQIALGEAWPGVQVDLRAHGNNVEKVFTVQPGADPGRVRLSVSGANSLTVDSGRLVVKTEAGEIAFSKPVAFQPIDGHEVPVDVAYSARGSEYGFSVAAYDRTHALVIDPLLQATYLGGGNTEGTVSPIAIHSGNGDVYVAGTTYSSDFPGTASGAQTTTHGNAEMFVARLDPTLTVLRQATYVGGSKSDSLTSMAISASTGDVYIGGTTESTDFPATAGGADIYTNPTVSYTYTNCYPNYCCFSCNCGWGGCGTCCGYYFTCGSTCYPITYTYSVSEGVIARLSQDLTSLVQSTYLGGSSYDDLKSLAIHPVTGDVYAAGYSQSTDLPAAAGGARPSNAGDYDTFVSRLNAGLTSLLNSTYFGGSLYEDTGSVAIAPSTGDVYLTGRTYSNDLPGTAGGAQPAHAGNGDTFVARLNAPLSSLIQATYLGGSLEDYEPWIGISAATGEIYVAGNTVSTDFPGTAGGAQPGNGGSYDAFASRLNPQLTSLLQSTYVGASGDDFVASLAIHPLNGDVYIGGNTYSLNFPATSGGAQPSHAGGTYDVYVARLNPALTSIVQSTYLGGSGDDYQPSLAISTTTGDVYVAGQTYSSNFPGTAGGAQSSISGSPDIFVARLNAALDAPRISPDSFAFTPQPGVPLSTQIVSNTIQVSGINTSVPISVAGGEYKINSGSFTTSPGTISNGDTATVRHVSAATYSTDASTTLTIGSTSTTFTSTTRAAIPHIKAAPNLDFGNQPVGTTSASLPVTVTNDGETTINVTGTVAGGANPADFAVAGNNCGNLAVNASCTISFTFTPHGAGALNATVTISTDKPGVDAQIATSGVGTQPGVQLVPSPVSFADTPVGSSNGPLAVTLKNTGNGVLSITGIGASGDQAPADFSESNDCGPTLAANATCTIMVTFSPTANGSRTGTLAVMSNAPNSPATAGLSGRATQAAIGVSPGSVDFGKVRVDTDGPNVVVTVTNNGDATLTVNPPVVLGGNPSDFRITSTTCGSVAPQASCSINIHFHPQDLGARGATLNIPSNAPGSPALVPLSGTGVAPAIAVSPTSLNFGNQRVGTASTPMTITVSNPGTDSLSVGTISLNPPFSMASNGCTAPVATQSSCTIGVVFTPSTPGAASGSVSIQSDAPNSPTAVPLSGNGIQAAISASGPLSFGNNTVGTTAPAQTVTVSNSGSDTLNVTAVAITGANAADFHVVSNNCGAGIAVGGNCAVGVNFTPSAAGARNALLSISSNAPTNPLLVGLSGNGLAVPSVSFATAAQSVNEGAGSVAVALRLSNAATVPVTIPLTFSGTAARPADYTASASSVTIPAGQTQGGITLSVVQDALYEQPNETAIVTAGTPTNATLGSPASHTVTIIDDDAQAVAAIIMTPETATKTVGTQACLVAQTRDAAGTALSSGIPITFTRTGANPGSATVNTAANGAAQHCWTGAASGTDSVVSKFGAISDSSVITWTQRADTLAPQSFIYAELSNPPRVTIRHKALLKDQATASPIAGRTLIFKKTDGTTFCQAVTGAGGWAICNVTVPGTAATITGLGYRVRFNGDAVYAPNTATGTVLHAGLP